MKILLCNLKNSGKYANSPGYQFARWLSSGYDGDDYQYIQRSKLPTYHFQPSLPRLPIPELDKTCQRYLASQKPLLSEDQYKKTETIVTKFLQNEGRTLNDDLVSFDKQNKHTSYISEPWSNMYLSDRLPLPINYNPLLVFVNDPKPEYNNQLTRSTNLIISSARFLKSIRSGILAPEVFHLNPKKSDTSMFRTVTGLLPSSLSWYGAYLFKAYPLDMSQYVSLFNSTRIPEVGKDRLFRDETAKHVLVMKNGNFYIFDVIDKSGNILPPDVILANMAYILEDKSPAAEFPVGVLTTGNRDEWAKARKHLELTGNKETLSLIDSSLFNLALDDVVIGEDRTLMLQNFLYGNGVNRWFDKSFSLLMAKDGLTALNFEHSWGDGVAVLRYFQDILKDSTENPRVHPGSKPATSSAEGNVKKLEFKFDEQSKQTIKSAQLDYEKNNALEIEVLEIPDFGKKDCKKSNVSPDAIMQLGIQAGYHLYTGSYVATYESCSTAAFKHGRTETIRPCTLATKAYCEAVNSTKNRPSDSELRAMITHCSQVHGGLTKDAAMGQGFDRHLFGLRLRAQLRGSTLPDIFLDPAYSSINQNILSTSTLSSSAVLAGGFGPVVKNGYGVGYTISDERLGVIVSSYPGQRNAAEYIHCLKTSFENIINILKYSKS